MGWSNEERPERRFRVHRRDREGRSLAVIKADPGPALGTPPHHFLPRNHHVDQTILGHGITDFIKDAEVVSGWMSKLKCLHVPYIARSRPARQPPTNYLPTFSEILRILLRRAFPVELLLEYTLLSPDGKKESRRRAHRDSARHSGYADPADTSCRSGPWAYHRPRHWVSFGRSSTGRTWVALSCLAPDRRPRLDCVILGNLGKQPQSALLPFDPGRPQPIDPGDEQVGACCARSQPGAPAGGGLRPRPTNHRGGNRT